MLQLLVYFLVISGISIIWGLPVYLLPAYKRKLLSLNPESILLSFFIGLGIVSILSSLISLFFPARIEYLLALTIPLLAVEIISVKQVKLSVDFQICFSKSETIFFLSCLALFTVLAIGKPSMEDSDLYHVQNIKWAHEYGTVPGVANLYLRYGFYSNWFTLVSTFKLPFAQQNYNYLNYTYCIWVLAFFFEQFKRGFGKTKIEQHISTFSFTLVFFMLAEWDLFRVASSSTSYDFVVSCSVLVSIVLLIRMCVLNETTLEKAIPFILIPAFYYKLTGFLAIPLLIFFLCYSTAKWKSFISCSIIGIIGFIAFFLKNFIQTGYPFFPYQFASFMHADWKVPNEMVTLFNKYIYLSNHYIRFSQNYLEHDKSTITNLKTWFTRIPNLDAFIVTCSFISLPIGYKSLKKKYKGSFNKILLLHLACLLSIITWLLTSPDLRFAFGFICFILLFPFASLVRSSMLSYLYKWIMWIFIFGICIYTGKKANRMNLSFSNIVYVQEANVPPLKKTKLDETVFFIPETINNNWNSRCIDCPLPCIYKINPYLRNRGNNIKSGFKMWPHPDSSFVANYRY